MRSMLCSALLAVGAIACGGAGLGDTVRQDISTQMATIQEPVSACYASALQRDRKLRGTMMVSFDAEPKTGTFTNIRITGGDLRDEELQSCVTEQVSGLALSEPQKTVVSVSYPLEFSPTN